MASRDEVADQPLSLVELDRLAFFESLNKLQPDIASMEQAWLLADIHFGDSIGDPFAKVMGLIREVRAAAHVLQMPGTADCDPEFQISLMRKRWALPTKDCPDEIAEGMQQQKERLKSLLRPHVLLQREEAGLRRRRWWRRRARAGR